MQGVHPSSREDSGMTVVVFDDDPTGTQTISDLDVYTRWDTNSLTHVLDGAPPAFFLLTNSRAMNPAETADLHARTARQLLQASQASGRDILLVSRGDSTLRGHFPLETDALAQGIRAMGGQVDATLLCPCFVEGGRVTEQGVHYLIQAGERIPVGETEFARDRTFGYRASFLPGWVEEKTGGRIAAQQCAVCTLDTIRAGQAYAQLMTCDALVIALDGETQEDMRALADAIRRACDAGKRFMIRCAASLVQALCGQEHAKLLPSHACVNPNGRGSLLVVGSYVEKTNEQLRALRDLNLRWIEFDIHRPRDEAVNAVTHALLAALHRDEDIVLYTSRAYHPVDEAGQLNLSTEIAAAVARVVSAMDCTPRFVIAKGGITSYTVGVSGLGAWHARVIGCAAPGIPVWRMPEGSRFPGMPYVIFPGNVGNQLALRTLLCQLLDSAKKS